MTFPTPTSYTVVVPEPVIVTQAPTLRFPLNLIFSIAYAEVITMDNNFNFGNVFSGGTGGDSPTNSRGGGGGGSKPHTSGTNIAPTPLPQVLGESISMIPSGSPATGAGGTASNNLPTSVYFLALLILVQSFLKNKNTQSGTL